MEHDTQSASKQEQLIERALKDNRITKEEAVTLENLGNSIDVHLQFMVLLEEGGVIRVVDLYVDRADRVNALKLVGQNPYADEPNKGIDKWSKKT